MSNSEPLLTAARSRGAWCLFLGVFLATLAVDLGLKVWSFANVGDRPVLLLSSSEDAKALTPEVLHTHFPVFAADPHHPAHNAGILALQPAVTVVPGLLDLRLTTNTGAVFGLGSGNRSFFIVVSVLALGVIAYLLTRTPATAWWQVVAYALIAAGAIGNLYDRARFGAVRDMLHLLPGVDLPFGLAWPGTGSSEVWPWIFNPADVALLSGVGLTLLLTLAVEWSQGRASAGKATA